VEAKRIAGEAEVERIAGEIAEVKEAARIAVEEEDLKTKNGSGYRGKQHVTKKGVECQRWDTTKPHYHEYGPDRFTEEKGFDQTENYCRNPDNSDEIWCYTMSDRNYDYCYPIDNKKK